MNIEINLIIKKESNYLIFINHLIAIKNGEIKKNKKEIDYLDEEKLKLKLKEISNLFDVNKYTLFIKTNNDEYKELIGNIFNSEIGYISEDNYQEELNDVKEVVENEHKVDFLPSFIYKTFDSEFEKNVLLFSIISYFNENPSHIFDFPLFLKMKKNNEVEDSIEVEEFVELYLEKLSKIGE